MKPLTNQHGAVLAFSLVMLLLLTLVGTSMIQQNKAQISLTSNTGQQTKTFSAVESALASAQAIINNQRYADINKHKCNKDKQIHESPDSSGVFSNLGTTAASGIVKKVYCLSNYTPSTGGNEYQCLYSGTGVRNLIVGTGTPAASSDNVNACKMLNAAGMPYNNNPLPCQIEEYLLNITLTDSTTGAKRTVESKLEVDCSGNLNP